MSQFFRGVPLRAHMVLARCTGRKELAKSSLGLMGIENYLATVMAQVVPRIYPPVLPHATVLNKLIHSEILLCGYSQGSSRHPAG